MKLIYMIFCAMLVTGCVNSSLKPTDPNRGSARTAQSVQTGVILDVKSVTLKGNTQAAQTVGAGLGGYIGNVLTRDDGEVSQILGTVAGAAIGSAAGKVASDVAMDQQGVELILKTQTGVISIVQQVDDRAEFVVGSTVWVVGSNNNIRALPKN